MSSSAPLPPSPPLVAEATVIVVGAGPSGLATAACLTHLSIPDYILLEKEDCIASLWKNKSYDRLQLHLAKPYSELPHLPLPQHLPKYVSRDDYVEYLDRYAAHFHINSRCFRRVVTLARYDEESGKWHVTARNPVGGSAAEEEYVGRFLVVATGEASDPFVPKVEGLAEYTGKVVHSTEYKSGKEYGGGDDDRKSRALVVGCGNSGMEIAFDLASYGADTSIVVRSPVHILTRGTVDLGLKLVKLLPLNVVDTLMVTLSKLVYGDLSKHGIDRPQEGPFLRKDKYGNYPVVDVGTVEKIKAGDIKVLPAIERIKGKEVMFVNGESYPFDAIIFATGFRRSTNTWLKGDDSLLKEDGMPKQSYPNHWKGEKGSYCAGFARKAIVGHGIDALNIATDIKSLLS